ncbi:LysR family transcriptional regulator [Mycobacteroides abscessus subsp. massiliense]|uniref:LysR family transcriptional regulator n=1 Tax=Mycobacteroides abscessus TaxID=36809 RepID=UPI0009A60630|nr:LysR family transcriptional regulator [Mycobacteroides abscessus]SKG20201.1 LysR family transcriptional regulator [Mycobacteroides abscessus subsp. massiliense]SKH86082.1 LysR family transcriptional regulator [Mycobacteroides abscessus subsp. massiliense]SKJ23732.1 LysR family transcriptional regulator [Mycobacteroides abscessus subsp. massiliense]SKK61527.1 LysR family transcriptional regulator [Mycobacteroides abscessus subsp. massiliense]SKL55071.1 LysR family transcriptional regulator [
MELSDITHFLAVAEAGGISHASKRLHTVQSNVSTHIKALEDELGVELFRRHARGMALTNAGEAFLPYAERITALLREATQVVGDEAEPTGTLAIGSMETTAGLRLPGVLAAFAAACPRVDFTLATGTTAELIDMVTDRRLDGAFVCGPIENDFLTTDLAFVEELVLLTAQRHTEISEVFGAPTRMLVFRNGCSYRARLQQIFTEQGVDPQVLEFGSIEGILGCVAADMGVSLLPAGVVSASQRATLLRMHPLPPMRARVETVFVRRADAALSPAMAQFLRELQRADTPVVLRSVAP